MVIGRLSLVVTVVFSLFGLAACGQGFSSGPQGDQGIAVGFVAYPDVAWDDVHPDIKANTTEPTTWPVWRRLRSRSDHWGRLDPNKTTDNGGTWGTITLSASDGYVRDGITHVDVLVEDDESGNETGLTALIFHEDGEPEGQPWIVGAIPEYPCLVGAETIRQQLLGE